MAKVEDGGAAFPVPTQAATKGMSLRDWFAGRVVESIFGHHMADGETTVSEAAKLAAIWSYTLADAMLAERTRQSGAS